MNTSKCRSRSDASWNQTPPCQYRASRRKTRAELTCRIVTQSIVCNLPRFPTMPLVAPHPHVSACLLEMLRPVHVRQ